MFKKILKKIKALFNSFNLNDSEIINNYLIRQNNHKNILCRYGKKVFSQSDEDGITNEIIKRLDIKKGSFIELGIGDGLENNTLYLKLLGWNGLWIDGKDIENKPSNHNLKFIKNWIDKDNIYKILKDNIDLKKVNLVSIDLDGNDYYIAKELLEKSVLPDIFIVEYNGKFIPPSEFIIDYNPEHIYKFDDYYGASLQSFVNLFEKYKYKLICCNAATGANAFFVKDKFSNLFPEVPENIIDIYSDPYYFLPMKYGHKLSKKTIKKVL